jgi:hypothetical protein
MDRSIGPPTGSGRRPPPDPPGDQDPWLARHQPTALLGQVQCANCHWPYPCPTRQALATT